MQNLQCSHGVGRGKEEVLGLAVLLHEQRQMTHQEIAILHMLSEGVWSQFKFEIPARGGVYLDLFQGVDHGHVLEVTIGTNCCRESGC